MSNINTNYPISIIINNKIIQCAEVPYNETCYKRLVTPQKEIVVLYTTEYGSGWSTSSKSKSLSKQMMFDSRIIRAISDKDFEKNFDEKYGTFENGYSGYTHFLNSIFGDIQNKPSVFSFKYLKIELIHVNELFKINSHNGHESIDILDLNKYIQA
jgi:hypothetical protein